MGLSQELSSIKTNISDGVKNNKVSRFAYTETAYTENTVDGVPAYNVNAEQNIPLGTAEVMKVNQTVIEKGWRARASSITRMLMNHFLGRISYNLNKANDMINSILGLFISYIGNPDGIASLDSNAQVPVAQINKSDVGVQNGTNSFTTKGAYDYSLGSVTASSWLGKVFGKYLGKKWRQANGLSSLDPYAISSPIYANGLWIAGSGYRGLWWSEDGKNWTRVTGETASYTMRTPIYANGLWVAGSGSHGLWWSEDGKNWTQVTGSTASYSMYTPIYANGLWIAGSLSNGLWWSEDGKNWTGDTTTDNGAPTPFYANNLWVASVGGALCWSENGKTWAQGTSTSTIDTPSVPFYANGLWVVGSHNGLWWSENGKSWTQVTGDTTSYMMHTPIYANGLWVAGSFNGSLWWSEDGKNWTQGTGMPSLANLNTPSYANGLWLAGTIGQGLWRSEDGKNWEHVIDSSFDLDTPYYIKGLWIAGSGTGHGLWWSDVDMLKEEGIIVD